MSASDILTLEKPMAPRLIRILYALTLIIIAIFVIAGVARGIARMVPGGMNRVVMMGPPGPPPPSASSAATNPAPPPAAQPSQPPRPMIGPGRFGGRFFMRQGRRGPRGGLMRRGPSALVGTFEIVRTLVMGAVMLMVVRILAELAGAILKMPQKE